MSVVVRTPVLADVPALARINVDTWRAAYAGIVPEVRLQMSVEQYAERWRDNLEAGRLGVEFLAAEIDGEVVGYAILGGYRAQDDAAAEDTAGMGELFALYVDAPRQGRGAGRTLHDAAVSRLAARSYVRAALWVLAENTRAIEWYERRGWLADGVTGSYRAAGASLPEIRMARSLV